MIHKAIKGYEDYLISDTGMVYSLKSQKYLKPWKGTHGYYQVTLCKNGSNYHKCVHRLVAEAFIENPNNKPTVDHINRDKADNRVENLRWADGYLQNKNRDFNSFREKCGISIIEIVDNKEIKYPALRAVPDISQCALSQHILKGETDFTIKQRNGNVRHFIVPEQKGK